MPKFFKFFPSGEGDGAGGGTPPTNTDQNANGGAPPAPPPTNTTPPKQDQPVTGLEELTKQKTELEEKVRSLSAELAAFKDGNGNALVKQKDDEIASLKEQLEKSNGSEAIKSTNDLLGQLKEDLFSSLSKEDIATIEDISSIAGDSDAAKIRAFLKLRANKKIGTGLTSGTNNAINQTRAGGTPSDKPPASLSEARAAFVSKAKSA